MNLTVQPVMFKGEYSKREPAWSKEPKSNMTESEKDAWNKGFLSGAVMAAMLGIGSTITYNDYQTQSIIKDMQEEVNTYKPSSFKVQDMNEDNVPEIVLKSNDGSVSVYDMYNHDVYLQMNPDEDELIEKIR